MDIPGVRIQIPLDRDEFEALMGMAQKDCRDPKQQVRFLIRKEAQCRGLVLAGIAAFSDPKHTIKLLKRQEGGNE